MANQPSFIKEFIDVYRRHNCLWQVKSSAYANRCLRSKAYEDLLLLLKSVDNEATVDSVKNKINNIRSAFRKELKKVKESKRSGASSDAVYTPTLWYYDSLLFTVDHEQCRETISSCVEVQDAMHNEENEVQEENESEYNFENFESVSLLSPPTPSSVPSRTSTPTPRKAAKRSKNDLMLEKAHAVLSRATTDNEFKTVGENVAWKLARMAEDQRNIAEHLINNILHYGITKKLNDNTTIHLHPQTPNIQTFPTNHMIDYSSIHSTHQQTHFSHIQPHLHPHTKSQTSTYTPLQSPNEIQTQQNYQQLGNQANSNAGESSFNMKEYMLLSKENN